MEPTLCPWEFFYNDIAGNNKLEQNPIRIVNFFEAAVSIAQPLLHVEPVLGQKLSRIYGAKL